MSKQECLTITTNLHSNKRVMIETTRYEMLGTSESGHTRIIDVVEVEKVGKKKATYRHQHKLMALPEGRYLTDHTWDDTQPGKFKAMVSAWLALPYKDGYKTHGGLYSIESRYLQTVQMHKVCEP